MRVGARVGLVLAALGSACFAEGAAGRGERWIAVVAPDLREAVEPLCQARRRQGFDVVVVTTTELLTPDRIVRGDAGPIRDRVLELCRDRPGDCYVLLVGEARPQGGDEPWRHVVPALTGRVARMRGQPTDLGYGRTDDRPYPTVAVGRMPARNAQQARDMVAKTLAWERGREPGAWRRQVTVLAGSPMYNKVVDALLERLVIGQLARLGASWSVRAVYDNENSRFHVPPAMLNEQATRYVTQGQAILLYVGHSSPRGIWGNEAPFLLRRDLSRLSFGPSGGVFITFGCWGCQLAGGRGQGYGLAAMRNPRGPVAVIGATGECFPAMMLLQADGMLVGPLTDDPPPRLGHLWLAMQKSLATAPLNRIAFSMLNCVDGDPGIPADTQRLEHLEMFVLLGDPAIRLAGMPSDVQLDVPPGAAPGTSVRIGGRLPQRLAGANVRVTIERPLTSSPMGIRRLPPKTAGTAWQQAVMANHERANRFVLVEKRVVASGREFQAILSLPQVVPPGDMIVRVYASTLTAEAMGVATLRVVPPTRSTRGPAAKSPIEATP